MATKKLPTRKTAAQKASKKVTKKRSSKSPAKTSVSQAVRGKAKRSQKGEKKSYTLKGLALGDVVAQIPIANNMKPIVSRERLEIAFLTPFRFPLDYDRLASQTARYTGIFFVIVGAIFTLINMQQLNGYFTSLDSAHLGQRATLVCTDPNNPETCTESATTSSSGGSPGTLQCTNPTQPGFNELVCQPSVEFITERRDVVSGTVSITFAVSHAQSVKAMAFRNETGQQLILGAADQSSTGSDSWKFNWDTTQYDDGIYTLKVLVANEYGQYDDTDSVPIVIKNNPATQPYPSGEPGSTTTAAVLTTTDSAEGSVLVRRVEVTAGTAEPFSKIVTLTINVINAADAQKITFFADEVSIGHATRVNNSVWSYRWDTTRLQDGAHTTYVKAYFTDGSTLLSERDSVKVKNSSSTPVAVDKTLPVNVYEKVLAPEITITVPTAMPLSRVASIQIDTPEAKFVEVYAIPKYALSEVFLGLASRVDPTHWNFRWDTTHTPNGEYKLFVRVKNSYGLYSSKQLSVAVKNETVTKTSASKETYIEELQDVQTFIGTSEEGGGERNVAERAEDITIDFEISPETELLLTTFREELSKELGQYAAALRNMDEERIRDVKVRIQNLKKRILDSAIEHDETSDIVAKIDAYLEQIIRALELLTEKHEEIIRERVGDKVFNDADKDTISDYDEINLYGTDPFSADTDGDGFDDGTEILNGYDPLDERPEVLVVYESPQEAGTLREDLLAVSSIVTLSPEATDTVTPKRPTAVISGKGLPNSFVTLYIFSTPVVVTVKTNDDGSWSYRFDKELADGEHEIYVGVTDNAGKIVAKSNSFAFIKTAQAFSEADAATALVTSSPAPRDNDGSFISRNIILIVSSIGVVALGLVLLLLGLHMQLRSEEKVRIRTA